MLEVRFDRISKGWEQWVFMSSDRHHDNIHCDQKFEKMQLEQVKERDALIVDTGDLFCAMQGKYDPRSSLDELREEDKREDYLDAIVEHAVHFYQPYAKHFLLVGRGNHETNIRKRHGTDLTSNLVYGLNRASGNAVPGGYGGWIRFMFTVHKTVMQSKKYRYYHGTGGGAPVTRGVIQTNRQAVYLPDADIVHTGHNHHSYIVPIKRERLSDMGQIKNDVVYYVRTPGYKDEWGDGFGGFAVEKGHGPRPIGGCWLRFYVEGSEIFSDATLAIR